MITAAAFLLALLHPSLCSAVQLGNVIPSIVGGKNKHDKACPAGCDVWFDGCNLCPCLTGHQIKCKSLADSVDPDKCKAGQSITGTHLPYCFDWKDTPHTPAPVPPTTPSNPNNPVSAKPTLSHPKGICFLGCLEWQSGASKCPCQAEGIVNWKTCVQDMAHTQTMLAVDYCSVEYPYDKAGICAAEANWAETRAGKVAYHPALEDEIPNNCVAGETAAWARACSYLGVWDKPSVVCHTGYCLDDGEWTASPAGKTVSLPCSSGMGMMTRICQMDETWSAVDDSQCPYSAIPPRGSQQTAMVPDRPSPVEGIPLKVVGLASLISITVIAGAVHMYRQRLKRVENQELLDYIMKDKDFLQQF